MIVRRASLTEDSIKKTGEKGEELSVREKGGRDLEKLAILLEAKKVLPRIGTSRTGGKKATGQGKRGQCGNR